PLSSTSSAPPSSLSSVPSADPGMSPFLVPTSFFFTDPSTTEIYTLSLHDALPICGAHPSNAAGPHRERGVLAEVVVRRLADVVGDRKSTRLNSSHGSISYAVFCLKKKTKSICGWRV